MVNWPKVHALIPAAGLSVRFGGTTLKQYASIHGHPVMALSIAAVQRHPAVTAVTVILAQDDGIYRELLAPGHPEIDTTVGGASRAESVHNGLQYILRTDPAAEWVLIHDAARPCLSKRSLGELLDAMFAANVDGRDVGGCDVDKHWPDRAGAILAVEVADTIKRAIEPPVQLDDYRQSGHQSGRKDNEREEHDERPRIHTTVDRSGLWVAQTPQLFPLRLLAENVTKSIRGHQIHTDEASVMEAAGYHPLLVPGSPANIKITGPKDLALAEAILEKQRYDAEERSHATNDISWN